MDEIKLLTTLRSVYIFPASGKARSEKEALAMVERIAITTRAAFIIAGAIVATILIGGPAVKSFVGFIDTREQALTIPEHVIKANREDTFRTLCPDYAVASTWERWTNSFYWDIGWCKDYIDRL